MRRSRFALAAIAVAVAVATSLSLAGCSSISGFVSRAGPALSKWTTTMAHAADAEAITSPKIARGIDEIISDARAIKNPTLQERLVLVHAENLKAYQQSMQQVADLAAQASENNADDAARVVSAQLRGEVNDTFRTRVDGIVDEMVGATTCALAEEGMDAQDKEKKRLLAATPLFDGAAAVDPTDEGGAATFVGERLLELGYQIAEVDRYLPRLALVHSILEKANGTITAITKIEEADNPATTREWMFYLKYCVVS